MLTILHIKVHIFREGHKILRNLHRRFDLSYLVPVKSTVEILQNFVAFSEYMNFNRLKIVRLFVGFAFYVIFDHFVLSSNQFLVQVAFDCRICFLCDI